MPAITVSKRDFLEGIEKTFSDEEVSEILFDFGLELDDIVEDPEISYKIDIPANRYDLLCLQGLINGVSSYIQTKPQKKLSIQNNKEKVLGERPKRRPYIKLALLKGVDLSGSKYQDLIDFQDKLHQGLGQNRALVAIGTYDYDNTQRPYTYTTMKEEEISFIPLNQKKTYTRKDLDVLYKTDPKLKEYLHLSREEERVPVLFDGKKNILSLPPLINGDFSKITSSTKNILVDVTGTDLPRVCTAMYLLLHHFSDVSTEIEEFDTEFEEIERDPIVVREEDLEKELLLSITAERAKSYLERMMHKVEVENTHPNWSLRVYPTKLRPDILHLCDLIEDIAIAHGYNNFPKLLPTSYTIGKEFPLNKHADELRRECAIIGYTEMFTMSLLSKSDCFGFSITEHIQVKNPKSTECEVLRQDLAPSILKCISANQHHQLPIKIFEVSDVGVFAKTDVGVRNDKRLCMAISGTASRLEDLQESFDVVMKRIGVSISYRPEDTSPFLSQRSCGVYVYEKCIGHLGVVDPKISLHHKIPHVCSLVEISLTSLFG